MSTIYNLLVDFTQEQRRDVFDELRLHYCLDCGIARPAACSCRVDIVGPSASPLPGALSADYMRRDAFVLSLNTFNKYLTFVVFAALIANVVTLLWALSKFTSH